MNSSIHLMLSLYCGIQTDNISFNGIYPSKTTGVSSALKRSSFLYSLFFRKDRPLSSAAQLISTYIIGENGVTPEESMKTLHKYSLCSSQTIE